MTTDAKFELSATKFETTDAKSELPATEFETTDNQVELPTTEFATTDKKAAGCSAGGGGGGLGDGSPGFAHGPQAGLPRLVWTDPDGFGVPSRTPPSGVDGSCSTMQAQAAATAADFYFSPETLRAIQDAMRRSGQFNMA